MNGNNINNLGKVEKNQKVMSGECIFPFQQKGITYNECVTTDKGPICATSVSKKGTLKTYGYCNKLETATVSSKKKTMKRTISDNESYSIQKKECDNLYMKAKLIQDELDECQLQLKKMEASIENEPDNEPDNEPSDVAPTNTDKIRLNELFATIMSKMNIIHIRKGEPFRARAYKKAEETILLQSESIFDFSELKGLSNIGETILLKLKEIQETGTLKYIEREKNNPVQIFTQIYGIGPKKAESLISKEITTLEQLKENTDLLNDNQKIGLKYFDDISKRIPREVIDKYKTVFENEVQAIGKDIQLEIVGSYRRGTESSGDIDVIISSPNNDESIFSEVLNRLKQSDIIIEFLSKGKSKSLTIAKINDDIPRRVDFLYTSTHEYAFAKLYFTGSMGFNTVMRHRALQFGYSLNEHGISKMNGKEKGSKVPIEFPDEKAIFDFLKMEYKEPTDRKDGRAVISITGNPIITQKKISQKVTIPKKDTLSVIKQIPAKKNIKSNVSIKQQTLPASTDFIDKFRMKGVQHLNSSTEQELINIIKEANDSFFNDVSILTDSEYDIIKEYTEQKYPKNKELENIGAPVIDKNKATLPYFMGSMDKIKPDTNAIDKWKQKYKGPYVISAKLDGVSGLYSTENNEQKLYTRGNGTVGQDISYLVPHLRLPKDNNHTMRGEFIIDRNIFEEKYKSKFSNPRNFVSGVINSKTIDVKKLNDIEFVAYEIIEPNISPLSQMTKLDTMDVTTVKYQSSDTISNDMLSEILVEWRNKYKYESDGIIVTDDHIHERVNKNPEHSFAFKMVLSEQMAEAKVIDVIWNVSKHGLLKPKIQIEPIVLGGATIQYATAHNASTVANKQLGIGAIVKIIRSGDVIPYIMETIVPAEKIKMPDVDYVWNDTHVDIELANKENNEEITQKNVTNFFTGIEVDGLSSGNISRIIAAGYNSVFKIVKMNKDDFLKVEGFKDKLATKIYESIHAKLAIADLSTIMAASNIFGHGFGDRKMKLIMTEYPDIMTSTDTLEDKIGKLANVKGMAKKTAVNFVDKISQMKEFLAQIDMNHKLDLKITNKTHTYDTEHILYGKSIVFTGVREKQVMEKLENIYNVKLSSAVSKNTFAVITKSKDDVSGKLSKARTLHIPIFEIDEFKKEYSL